MKWAHQVFHDLEVDFFSYAIRCAVKCSAANRVYHGVVIQLELSVGRLRLFISNFLEIFKRHSAAGCSCVNLEF